jgi:hypothetical protein
LLTIREQRSVYSVKVHKHTSYMTKIEAPANAQNIESSLFITWNINDEKAPAKMINRIEKYLVGILYNK